MFAGLSRFSNPYIHLCAKMFATRVTQDSVDNCKMMLGLEMIFTHPGK